MAQLARYKSYRALSGHFLTRYGARFNSTLISVYFQRLPRTGAFLGVTCFVLLVKVAGNGRVCTNKGSFVVFVPSRLRLVLVARGPVVSWWTPWDDALGFRAQGRHRHDFARSSFANPPRIINVSHICERESRNTRLGTLGRLTWSAQ